MMILIEYFQCRAIIFIDATYYCCWLLTIFSQLYGVCSILLLKCVFIFTCNKESLIFFLFYFLHPCLMCCLFDISQKTLSRPSVTSIFVEQKKNSIIAFNLYMLPIETVHYMFCNNALLFHFLKWMLLKHFSIYFLNAFCWIACFSHIN